MTAEFVPKISESKYDVQNFDNTFTDEDAVNSVLPPSKLKMIQKYDVIS